MNIVIEIDGVRHKAVIDREEEGTYCSLCSFYKQCRETGFVLCKTICGNYDYHFEIEK